MEKRFAFGKNWKRFVDYALDERRIEEAVKSLKEFMKISDFNGKTFLDIGCGSGLFSYAAYKLGAKEVISFDIDIQSVKCCELLKSRENNPKNWKVIHGSILDKEFIKKLPRADIVYSWGVLHHTGKMWQAIENAAKLVKPGGCFYI